MTINFPSKMAGIFQFIIEVQHLKGVLGLVGLHLNGQAIIDICNC